MVLATIIANVISASTGVPLPIDQIESLDNIRHLARGGRRTMALLFKKSRMSRAQAKKRMMAKRRRFVDTVILEHERRVQKQNFENRINETTDRLRKLEKNREELSLARRARKSIRPKNNRYGNYDTEYDDEELIAEEQNEHLNTVQSIISNQKNSANQNWKDRTNKKGNSSREM